MKIFKTPKIQIVTAFCFALALGAGGLFLHRNHQARLVVTSLREQAQKPFQTMLEGYSQRLILLGKVDPHAAESFKGLENDPISFTQVEGWSKFDQRQLQISEAFSRWMTHPQSKKSRDLDNLKALEITINRSREAYHQLAFEANMLAREHGLKDSFLPVFQAEWMLWQKLQASKTDTHAGL
ncbi:MAG: hypothetical protein RJB38_1723 [Pseudomonadota bacterium]|jgi:hypothetical protein